MNFIYFRCSWNQTNFHFKGRTTPNYATDWENTCLVIRLRVHPASVIHTQSIWKETRIRSNNLSRLSKAFCGGAYRPRRILKSQRDLICFVSQIEADVVNQSQVYNKANPHTVPKANYCNCYWLNSSTRYLDFDGKSLETFTYYKIQKTQF